MKGLFVTATGTDTGKTYISALICKFIREHGHDIGYYKAAASGSPDFDSCDAGFVRKFASLSQSKESMLSYLFPEAVSPHLAARMHGRRIELPVIEKALQAVAAEHEYVLMEGAGGIVCPLCYEPDSKLMHTDLMQHFKLPVVLVADAGLGTLNYLTLSAHYLRSLSIPLQGIILNHYEDGPMYEDNVQMAEELTGSKVLALVRDGQTELSADCAIAQAFA